MLFGILRAVHQDRFSDETPEQQAQHTDIAHQYAWQAEQRRKRDQRRPITAIRLRELERLFRHRYGMTLPDDDAGRDDLTVAACARRTFPHARWKCADFA